MEEKPILVGVTRAIRVRARLGRVRNEIFSETVNFVWFVAFKKTRFKQLFSYCCSFLFVGFLSWAMVCSRLMFSACVCWATHPQVLMSSYVSVVILFRFLDVLVSVISFFCVQLLLFGLAAGESLTLLDIFAVVVLWHLFLRPAWWWGWCWALTSVFPALQ